MAEVKKDLATVAAARTRAEGELEEFRRATTSHTADLQAQVRAVSSRSHVSLAGSACQRRQASPMRGQCLHMLARSIKALV